jgi:signal transduction histidine kinase
MLGGVEKVNELDRLIELSDLNWDYTSLDVELDDLTRLAASICGAEMSLVNLIDRYTQWTVARHGTEIRHMPREDSVCQFTIENETPLELKGLKQDSRFKDKSYVCGCPNLNYYYGVPLTTKNGARIGALCVLDKYDLELNEDQTKLLEHVAHLVIRRMETIKRARQLQEQLNEARKSKRKVGHDVRGPISGILGLTDLLKEELMEQKLSEVDEMLTLIERSGESLLELADSILSEDGHSPEDYTCEILAKKLSQLYAPQAVSKGIDFSVEHNDSSEYPDHFPPKALLQIGGNLINNALKFTPEGGRVSVRIEVEKKGDELSQYLAIVVADNGVGMSEERIDEIMRGRAESEVGTEGERGYGLGLPLVRQLVENEKGTVHLQSKEGEGCRFTVRLPI